MRCKRRALRSPQPRIEMSGTTRRLADLLIDLHETLDLEIKGWLDLDKPDHQAKLAKAIIAMANHGGGYVVVGFVERPGLPAAPSPERPPSLANYNRDRVNGITEKYLEPPIHCEVHHVPAQDGTCYPLIVIPGGHSIPIMAKRDGPTGSDLKQLAVYIRRAGPKSETPRSAQEISTLFERCFANRRDDVGNLIRSILSGAVPAAFGADALSKLDAVRPRIDTWIGESCDRHAGLVQSLPADDARRFPRGYCIFAYQIRGALRSMSSSELLEALKAIPRHTGWPPWWVPTRPEIAPYQACGAIECWLGGDGEPRDAAHSDFWRVSPEGLAFLIRGYQEDGPDVERMGFAPGTVMDVTIPVWRVGEVLLHAYALALVLGEGQTEVVFRASYTGLAGRSLASVSRDRLIFEGRDISLQYNMVLDATVEASIIPDTLPEIIFPLVNPLYELFNFFKLEMQLVQEETAKMKSGRF